MKEIIQYQDVEGKLNKLLDENGLVGAFHVDKYPIVLSVGQNQSPAAQMELDDTVDNDASARDAKLKFIFRDGEILVRTDSRLVIPDALMSKIKGYAKKMHYLYLQSFFHKIVAETGNDKGLDNETEDEIEE